LCDVYLYFLHAAQANLTINMQLRFYSTVVEVWCRATAQGVVGYVGVRWQLIDACIIVGGVVAEFAFPSPSAEAGHCYTTSGPLRRRAVEYNVICYLQL
jgi:hypothetical protein